MNAKYFISPLIVIASSFAHAKTANPWGELAEQDVRAFYKIISASHPGPIDERNPQFKKVLDAGLKKALAKAKNVNSFEGLQFTLREFANSFEDGHLSVEPNLRRDTALWPGFYVGLRGDKYVVQKMESNDKALPEPGAVLISCDGLSPSAIMEKNVYPFFGNKKLEASRISVSPLLLSDYSNPFASKIKLCVFEKDSSQKTIVLNWKPMSLGDFNAGVRAAAFGERPKAAFRKIGADGYWISTPNFFPQGTAREELRKAIEGLKSERAKVIKAKFIVLDARGNTGGSSEWGEQVARLIWGDKMVDSRNSSGNIVEWRVSEENLKHLKAMDPELTETFGADSKFTRHFAKTRQNMSEALAKKQKWAREPDDDDHSPQTDMQNDVTAKIFFLTDGRCASACLDYADIVLAMPNVTHVGLPTSADTTYMEVRTDTLPSGTMRLNFATKVIRDRARGSNVPYVPQYRWDGDMDDSAGIEKWIAGLP